MKQKRRNKEELIKCVVARITKGAAFMLSPDQYRAEQTKYTNEVSALLAKGRHEFFQTYSFYLYDDRE